jgi:hypothetical protein
MATPNYTISNADKFYCIETPDGTDEYIFWFQEVPDLIEKFSEELDQKVKILERRIKNTRFQPVVTIDFCNEWRGDDNIIAVITVGDIEIITEDGYGDSFYIVTEVILRAGYYYGAVWDYNLYLKLASESSVILEDINEVIERFEPKNSKSLKRYVAKVTKEIDKMLDKLFNKYSNAKYRGMIRASNGEAFYIR